MAQDFWGSKSRYQKVGISWYSEGNPIKCCFSKNWHFWSISNFLDLQTPHSSVCLYHHYLFTIYHDYLFFFLFSVSSVLFLLNTSLEIALLSIQEYFIFRILTIYCQEVLARIFHCSIQKAETGMCIVSSRTARVTQRNAVSNLTPSPLQNSK